MTLAEVNAMLARPQFIGAYQLRVLRRLKEKLLREEKQRIEKEKNDPQQKLKLKWTAHE